MAVTLATGKIPFYGAVNNGAKSIKNTIPQYDYTKSEGFQKRGVCKDFEYIIPWSITLGGSQVNARIDHYRIYFYTQNSSDFLTYLKPQVAGVGDATIVGSVTDYTNHIYTLYHNGGYAGFQYPYQNVFIKDTGNMCFIRWEGRHVQELVITSDGYIQINTNYGKGRVFCTYGYKTKLKSPIYSEYYDTYSCNNCSNRNNCSYSDSTRTSCFYGFTTPTHSTSITGDFEWNYDRANFGAIDPNKHSILLCPSTTAGDYNFTAKEGYYISNTGLTPLAGELGICLKKSGWNTEDYCYRDKSSNEQGYIEYSVDEERDHRHRIPLFNTKSSSYPNLKCRVGDKDLYLRLRTDDGTFNKNDLSFKDGLLNLSYDGLIHKISPKRTQSKNIECFSGIFNNERRITGSVFTQGTSTSSSNYAYWNGASSISLSTRPYVSTLTLLIKYSTVDIQGLTSYPRSSNPYIRVYYNTGTSDITTENVSPNTMSYVDFNIPSPFMGYTVITLPINNYLKQFLIVPVITQNAVDSTGRYTYTIETVNLNMYENSENSFTYTL